MESGQSAKARIGTILAWPSFALIVFGAVPLFLLLRVSVAPHDPNGLWLSGVTLDGFWAAADRTLLQGLAYSLGLALIVATISLAAGFPLTYLVTRMRRGRQVAWLIFLLGTLSLSDVLIAFSWQVMLSKRIGLSNVLVTLGLMDHVDSLAPSEGAVIACLTYLVIPFTILTLYPGLSRLDRALIEAARTLGASPYRAFLSVVVPLARGPAMVAFLMSAVLTMGAYVPPIVLGRPEQWTMAVLIGNAALSGHDLSRASAMSVLLLLVTVGLALGTAGLARAKSNRGRANRERTQ